MRHYELLAALPALAASLEAAGAVLSGESAAHVHLAAATGSIPGRPPRYGALGPRAIEAIVRPQVADIPGVRRDEGAVAAVVGACLEVFSVVVALDDGTRVPALSREAVLAQLLAQGGLAIGLAGSLIRLAGTPPIDVDEVREILKAAGRGEQFQPLLELMQVA